MSYREYVPTCVETLFGRPPTKFKARAIIPESRTLNLDGGRCKCCTCEEYNSPKKTSNVQEDFRDNDIQYECLLNCPDCRKRTKKKDNIVPYNGGATEKRRFKDRCQNRRVHYSNYECYCTPQYNYAEGECYPQERTRMKHKKQKKKVYYSEPSRSTDSPDHSDDDRFCSVCHLWVRSECKEKRDEYSSKMYEEQGRVQDRKKTKEVVPCSRGFHIVVESCKFCGNRQDGPSESGKKGEEPCQALEDIVTSEEICEFGRKVEQCSRREGFFSFKQLNDSHIRSNDKERDSGDDIFEKFAEEMVSMEHSPETPIDEDLIQHDRQESVLISNKEPSPNREFKKAHSTSEINNIEKQYNNEDEDLEDYKKQRIDELKDKTREKTPPNSDFRSCNCEYARRDWKEETTNKLEPDISELRLLKQKCDHALRQLELFKREMVESKQGKCHCTLESTIDIVQDCKHRCAQLEKQVVSLQRTIDCYARLNATTTEGSWEFRRPNRAYKEMQRKQERTYERTVRGNSRKRDQSREVIRPNAKVSRKPKKTCPPPPVRNIRCQHIKCFPAEQIPDIPSFKMCSGYQEMNQKMNSKR